MSTADDCTRWLGLDQRIRDLTLEWQRLETHLMAVEPDYDEATSTHPDAVRMRQLENVRAAVCGEAEELLEAITVSAAYDWMTAMAKLQVAYQLLLPDEHSQLRALIGDALAVCA